MRNKFLWSLAATTLLASCAEDAMEGHDAPVMTGEKYPIELKINVGENATRAGIVSEKGAWTNYKLDASGMQGMFDHRLTIQIFDAANTTTPIVTTRRIYNPAAINSDVLPIIDDLRLPQGSYKVVTWVDFVKDDNRMGDVDVTLQPASTFDLFYSTDNLTSVVMKPQATEFSDLLPEGRDIYSAISDLEVVAPANAGDVSVEATKNITVKRTISKVRVVLTDYDHIDKWNQYFASFEGANGANKLNRIETTIKSAATTFNALTGKPVSTDETKQDVTIATNWDRGTIQWVKKDPSQPERFISVEDIEAETETALYPVLDLNYIFPNTVDNQSSAYAMTFKLLASNDGTPKVLKQSTIASVPARKNTLTTIAGNLLTEKTHFTITIQDQFDNFDNVTVEDDLSTNTEYVTIEGATVVVDRNADGMITKVVIKEGLKEDKVEAALTEIAGLYYYGTGADRALLIVNLETASDVVNIDFAPVNDKFRNITINQENGTNLVVTNTNTACPIGINANNTQAADLTYTGSNEVTVNGTVNDLVVTDNGTEDVIINATTNSIATQNTVGDIEINGAVATNVTVAESGDINVNGTVGGNVDVTKANDVTINNTVAGDVTIAEALNVTSTVNGAISGKLVVIKGADVTTNATVGTGIELGTVGNVNVNGAVANGGVTVTTQCTNMKINAAVTGDVIIENATADFITSNNGIVTGNIAVKKANNASIGGIVNGNVNLETIANSVDVLAAINGNLDIISANNITCFGDIAGNVTIEAVAGDIRIHGHITKNLNIGQVEGKIISGTVILTGGVTGASNITSNAITINGGTYTGIVTLNDLGNSSIGIANLKNAVFNGGISAVCNVYFDEGTIIGKGNVLYMANADINRTNLLTINRPYDSQSDANILKGYVNGATIINNISILVDQESWISGGYVHNFNVVSPK
ncbi:MAG: DUF6562 domain-containing protein [Marinifilaceae bacterium]